MKLTRKHLQAMRRHAARCAPLEACGLLAGREGHVHAVLPMTNRLHSPVRFRMEPIEQLKAFRWIEERDLELLAIYHSHPAGPCSPSPTDIAEAAYPVVQVILSPSAGKWQAHGFWIENGQVTEVNLDETLPAASSPPGTAAGAMGTRK